MFIHFLDFICDLLSFSNSPDNSNPNRLGDAPIDRQRRRWQKQMAALIALGLLAVTALVMLLTGYYPTWDQMQTFMDFSGSQMLNPPR